MTQTGLAGLNTELDASGAGGGGGTVVVAVKLDSHSRELLTWALVKVAQPGDCVLALHVLNNNEIVDREGKSSLLSLVKAFDSVLAVYEGFCNLKQVDLKLKVCRGSPIRKILVREAKSYNADEVIVGTGRKHHTLWSSTSVAKYCARKLPKECSILAVNNGKVVFQREASRPTNRGSKGTEDHLRNGLLETIQRSLSKASKELNDGNVDVKPTVKCDLELVLEKADSDCAESVLKQKCSVCSPDSVLPDNSCTQCVEESSGNGDEDNSMAIVLELASEKADSDCAESVLKQKCSVCSPDSVLLDNSCTQCVEESSGNGDEDNSMAIVPVDKPEAASSSLSVLIRELPEVRPGWPLLRQAVLSNKQSSDRSPSRQISVVKWALQLPSRHCLPSANYDQKDNTDGEGDRSSNLDGESGAIVPVGTGTVSGPSPECCSTSLPKELDGLHERYSSICRLFEYEELKTATSNFVPENLIGKGGSSQVYRGCLPDGKELAVKILKPSEDVLKEFVLEIEIITALHHKNIISLLGFCFEDNNLLLVYEFLSRGSLEENLHGNKKASLAFGWSERYKVGVGVAEALDYLHNRSAKSVIHRDVKSSNILLSDDFEPQLSDFGLAKWASTSSSFITCNDVAGTFGYLAPEYFMYGKVNEKIDVYAFGVVILELLSGRKPISSEYPKGQESLVMWAKPILNGGKVAQLLDPSLGNNYDRDQLEIMVLAATLCIRRAPRARPQMSLVMKLLQGDAEVMKWARLQVNALEWSDMLDDEASPRSDLQSHLNLALLDVDEESLSMSSIEHSVSLEDYLQGRWSRSSSID
ncbi:protein kinase STUNTED-like [Cornus florida]|uniref:protein kinase STUNTED-like n=1 Tax=Cornus florida TaxID=4283 RepID=UPI00289B18F2|nr:protein kinase STUNTED-like [Cornus florida]